MDFAAALNVLQQRSSVPDVPPAPPVRGDAATATTGAASANIGYVTRVCPTHCAQGADQRGAHAGRSSTIWRACHFSPDTLNHRRVTEQMREEASPVRTLVIDEVSMMGAKFYARVEEYFRAVRDAGDVAFGGINVYLFGDFSQVRTWSPTVAVAFRMFTLGRMCSCLLLVVRQSTTRSSAVT